VTTWTLFGQANPGSVTSGTGNNGTNGLHVTVNQPGTLDGIWHYSPATSTQLPTSIGLYTTQAAPASGTLVHSETATWSGAAGSGWVFAKFTNPPVLVPGVDYMATNFRNDAAAEWFVFYAVTWPAGNGILTAPKDESTSALSQGWYNIGTAMAMPLTQSGTAGSNFGMDVQVSTLPAQQQQKRSRPAAAKARLRSPAAGTPAGVPAAPFSLPAVLQRAHSWARRSRLASSPGSPAVPAVTPPFTPPRGTVRGRPAARRSRTAGSAGSPTVLPAPPSPFALPGLRRGRPAAARARGTASAGSPFVPPGPPAPFAPPAFVKRGRPAAARARLGASPGSPAVIPSPFAVPAFVERGKAVLRRARLGASPGSPAAVPPPPFTPPAVIQRAHGIARRTRTGFSSGSPAVVPSPVPSPFALPGLRRGKAAARRARLALSAGAPAAPPPPPAFPQSPLDLRCEVDLSGTWTDVTAYAYQRDGQQPPVRITRGRPDESAQANPSACAWQWNNRDGRFSPKNPLSPHYGMLGRNTPVRWSVPAKSNYLRLENGNSDRAFVQDGSALHVTGSIEVRAALRLTDWQGCVIAARYDNTVPSWYWLLNGDGTVTFSYFDSGGTQRTANSDVPLPFASGDVALRVTLDATVGTLAFYTSSSIDGTWTQLGDAFAMTGGAATSVRAGNCPLVAGWSNNIGNSQMYGRMYEFRMYNGIGGAIAADGLFSAQAPGTAAWNDSAGNTWTIAGGAEISGRDYRFHGEMSAQPPKWDVTGADHWIPAQAGGPLRRMSQGTRNAMSAMKRAILLQAGNLAPIAYWPMEDAKGSTVFGAAAGGAPAVFDASPAPNLASDSSFTASAPLPALNGSRVQFPVPVYTDTGSWAVRFLLKVSPPSANATLLRIVSSAWAACPVIYVNVDTGGNLELEGFAPDGSVAFNTGFFAFGATSPLWLSVQAEDLTGSTVRYSLVTVAPGASFGLDVNQVVSGQGGTASLAQLDPTGAFTGTVAGHMQVQSAVSSLFTLGQPLNAWQGETAAARYARLCGENGYQARILGSPAYSAPMGAQGQATLDNLLKECETADMGQQFEPRQVLGLGYRTLASMCGQAPALVLDYSAAQPGGVNGSGDNSGLDPTYDDQLLANDWTVSRGSAGGGTGATWQTVLNDGSPMSISDPPAGAGDYAKTATVNAQYDSQLPDAAGWRVHQGTVDEARWPVIPVNLARAEMSPLYWAALGLDAGDYLELLNVPHVILYDPVKQAVFGFKESLGGFHYAMEFSAVPESVYETAVMASAAYGRPDTDGSVLLAPVGTGDTSFQVVTPNAQLITWTVKAADFPFDIGCDGERMTVTNITGTGVSTQTFTVTRAVNGVSKAHAAGAAVRLWFPPFLAVT